MTLKRLNFVMACLLLLIGCQAGGHSPDGPVTPEATPSTPQAQVELISEDKLKVVIPRLNRGSKMTWGRKTTVVPGHLSTWLVSREQKKPLLIVSVDDLKGSPERLAHLREMSGEIRGFPAERSRNSWVRVLVSDRFEVVVRGLDKTYFNQKKLDHWLESLNLKRLAKLDSDTSNNSPG